MANMQQYTIIVEAISEQLAEAEAADDVLTDFKVTVSASTFDQAEEAALSAVKSYLDGHEQDPDKNACRKIRIVSSTKHCKEENNNE